MAILKQGALPSRKIIDGFKGKIDFYYYMGLPCARKWPLSQGKSQTPASVAQQPRFAYVSRLYISISPFVRDAYFNIARDAGLHAKDWFMRGYLTGMYKYPVP